MEIFDWMGEYREMSKNYKPEPLPPEVVRLRAEAAEKRRVIPERWYQDAPELTPEQSKIFMNIQYEEWNEFASRSEFVGHIIRCRTCRTPQYLPLNKKCNYCNPKQTGHHLARAFNSIKKTADRYCQPHHTTFKGFIESPFIPPIELHADHRAYRIAKRDNPSLTMLDFLNITPPPIPEDAPDAYLFDTTGFSYPQWLVYQAHPNTDPKRLIKAVRAMSHSHTIEDHHAPGDSRWDKTQSFANYCEQTVDSQAHTR